MAIAFHPSFLVEADLKNINSVPCAILHGTSDDMLSEDQLDTVCGLPQQTDEDIADASHSLRRTSLADWVTSSTSSDSPVPSTDSHAEVTTWSPPRRSKRRIRKSRPSFSPYRCSANNLILQSRSRHQVYQAMAQVEYPRTGSVCIVDSKSSMNECK